MQQLARILRTPVLLALAVFVLATPTAANAATGAGPSFGPSLRLAELHARISETDRTTTVHWLASERLRILEATTFIGEIDRTFFERNGSTELRGSGMPSMLRSVEVIRQSSLAEPDGGDELDQVLLHYGWPLVTRVRSGGAPLTPVTVGGRAMLRGTIRLAANECAALTGGFRTVWFDARTLVPLRVIDRRGGKVTFSLTAQLLRRTARDFAPIHVSGRRSYSTRGFVRRTPAAAAALVSYPVLMPSSVPSGFRLAHTGTGTLGGMLGPEGSFPQSTGVFFAHYVRGLEQLDLSIRPARSTLAADWDQSDPFGGECAAATTTAVTVQGHAARYATGERGNARLWWRDGSTLFTLSGPLAPAQLVAVGDSLQAVPE
ncbi:MAG: hypothetical protein JWM86_697 [Thermoleophilia bacterium]|nr:hypothetical protein [Thermoleophilia bacterium]